MLHVLYIAIVLVTSACGLIVEIVAGRMLAPYVGMSVYTWTAVIAVVLAGFSLGHWIGGRVTFVLVASERPTGHNTLRSRERPGRRWARWPSDNLARRIAMARVPVLTDDHAPIDRLMAAPW